MITIGSFHDFHKNSSSGDGEYWNGTPQYYIKLKIISHIHTRLEKLSKFGRAPLYHYLSITPIYCIHEILYWRPHTYRDLELTETNSVTTV